MRLVLLVLLVAAIAAAAQTPMEPFTFRVVATGFQSPWEITWGPDNYLWVTERVGKRVMRVNPQDGSKHIALTLPEVYQDHTQDGLLGMAVDPEIFHNTGNDYVYIAFTYDADPSSKVNRQGKVRRYTYNFRTETLLNPTDLLTNLPAGSDHVAFRLIMGPDRKLYFSIGDQGANFLRNYCNPNRAQELPSAAEVQARDWTKYQGKLLRLNLDGSVPADNPVINRVRSHIFSYGHRNPQGLVFGPGGTLYESEHGPSTDDEINLIEAGKNYGWPDVAGYNDNQTYVYSNWSLSNPGPCGSLPFNETVIPPSVPRKMESTWSHVDFRYPLKTFFTVFTGYDPRRDGPATVAPSSLEIYTAGSGIPGWANSLLLPGLTMGRVYRLKLADGGQSAAGDPTEHFRSANRYRDLAIDPSGTVYLVTDSEGRTLNPAGQSTRELANPGAIVSFSK